MRDSTPSSSGSRNRAASDPHTAIPARVRQNNDNDRTRRASDAYSNTRTARSGLKSLPERALRINGSEGTLSDDQSSATAVADGGRDTGPTVPPRTYEPDPRSPTTTKRATFGDRYSPSPRDSNRSPQPNEYIRSRLPQVPQQAEILTPSHPSDHKIDLAKNHQNEVPSPPPFKRPSLWRRFRDFWIEFSKEPPLPSPPPSPTSSRRNSLSGFGEKGNGQPGFGRVDAGGGENSDMFSRAMRINGDDDPENSLAADADVQPFGEENKDGQHKKLTYKERRKKRKHRIIYHRDTVDAQHRFILILARSLLTFGSLSHRIEPQLASVANIFELPAQFVHTPGCIQIAFGIPEHRTSETLLIKANAGLDLGRIQETHRTYRSVVRDEMSATEGRVILEELLQRSDIYPKKAQTLLTFAQGFILCGSSFSGSLNDMWVAGVLSVLVSLAQQVSARSELSSSGADIFTAGIISLVARALSVRVPNQIFCYQSISSASIAVLLPGSIMLSGVLDIASKNIYLGSPKLVTGLMTSLYLGFGLTFGSDIWLHFDSKGRRLIASMADTWETFNGTFSATNDTTSGWLNAGELNGLWSFQETNTRATLNIYNGCLREPGWPWFLQPLPWYSLFVLLPALNLVLSMKRAQPVYSVEMPVMVLISCTSTAVTQLANRRMGLAGHPDYTALLGSFVVSLLGNVYARKMGGTAFTIMLTGIWLLIPTGLAEAGGLSSSYSSPGQDEYTESLELARKMISVIIGVMSGVYLSARIVYLFGKKKNSAFVTF
ncbi:DUF1212-domain-containing protein [Phellopilus nigrolimitatus]|nr:DUF1212-domain-containing protein [Phellopilus nigrolimitatus]